MYDSVQTSLRDELTGEDRVPVGHRQPAGNDEGLVGVSVVDDLPEVVLQASVQFLQAEVVDDGKVVWGQFAEEVGLSAFLANDPEVLHQHVHGKVEHLPPLSARPVAKG